MDSIQWKSRSHFIRKNNLVPPKVSMTSPSTRAITSQRVSTPKHECTTPTKLAVLSVKKSVNATKRHICSGPIIITYELFYKWSSLDWSTNNWSYQMTGPDYSMTGLDYSVTSYNLLFYQSNCQSLKLKWFFVIQVFALLILTFGLSWHQWPGLVKSV